jgi:hypothetical protein
MNLKLNPVRLFTVVSATLALVTVFLPIFHVYLCDKTKAVILSVWLIVPPLWFWWEYIFIYRSAKDPEAFEKFKYGQEVSRNLWLGISAALTLLYFGHH